MVDESRIFIIGDIHGCLDVFKRLMQKIDWRPHKDRLILLGDYIDRGEDSKGVIDYLLELIHASDRVQCIMGNHEKGLIDFLSGKNIPLFFLNGGKTTLKSYNINIISDIDKCIPKEHLAFLKSLPLWLELEDYYVVHAGFRPGIEIKDQNIEDLTWIREPFLYSEEDFGKGVIFGHTPFPEPFISKNKIGIDTGAVYGNKLTCLELPSLTFHFEEV